MLARRGSTIRTRYSLIRPQGSAWFTITEICNRVGTLLLYAVLGAGRVSVVARLVAFYPMITVGLKEGPGDKAGWIAVYFHPA